LHFKNEEGKMFLEYLYLGAILSLLLFTFVGGILMIPFSVMFITEKLGNYENTAYILSGIWLIIYFPFWITILIFIIRLIPSL